MRAHTPDYRFYNFCLKALCRRSRIIDDIEPVLAHCAQNPKLYDVAWIAYTTGRVQKYNITNKYFLSYNIMNYY